MNGRFVAVSSLLLATLQTTLAMAQTAETAPPVVPITPPPDVVVLKSGGMVRGTISEQTPGGEVVIVLMSGETRRFAMTDVSYAGPSAGMPPSAPPLPPKLATTSESGEPAVTIAGDPGVTVHVRTESATAFIEGNPTNITSEHYRPLCTAPCEKTLPRGTYTIAVSKGTGTPVKVDSTVTVEGPTRLRATFDGRGGIRVAGYIVAIGGIVLGGFLITKGLDAGEKCTAGICEKKRDDTLTALGGGVVLGGILVGYLLASIRDKGSIEILPVAPPTTSSSGRGLVSDVGATWKNAVSPGVTVAGHF